MPHVLIVDDEPGMGETLQDILTDEGHQVSIALGGGQALDILARSPDIDLVLLDMRMPDMNGAQLLQELRRLCPDLPVVTMSGYSPEEWLDTVRQGVWASLTKPVDIVQLLGLVERAGAR